jgi:5-hydroxyisourate hydrolase
MITTHVLDIAQGTPAAGITVILERRDAGDWLPIGRGVTDVHGRLVSLTDGREIASGTYRLTFDLGDYHREQGIAEPFFPEAKVIFNLWDPGQHCHVPLLISPYGYSTYRGS